MAAGRAVDRRQCERISHLHDGEVLMAGPEKIQMERYQQELEDDVRHIL